MILFKGEIGFVVPPKSNRYLSGRNGRRYIPERIKRKIEEAIVLFMQMRDRKIEEECELYVRYTFPDRKKRDIDNMNKSLQDCLEKAGIVKDDGLFVKVLAEKVVKKGKEKTEVYILKKGTIKTPLGE